MAAADYYDDVQKVYVAYYGRPADREGLLFWSAKLDAANGSLSEIINAFGTSAEATSLFGGLTVEQMVSAIYTQLFNRLPDPEGLDFYSQGIMHGDFTLASVMLDVLNGAKGGDVAIIEAKLAAADAFTGTFFDGVSDTEEVLAYQGDSNAVLAREWLADVTDAASATAAEATIGDTLTAMSGADGDTFTLTASVDNVVGTNNNDTIVGVFGAATGDTYGIADSIDGGDGDDTLALTVNTPGNASPTAVSVTNVEAITIRDLIGAEFDATLVEDTPSITFTNTLAGQESSVTGVALASVIGLSGKGDLTVDYASTSGSADAAAISLQGAGTSATVRSSVDVADGDTIESLSIATSGTNYVDLVAGSKAATVTITGNGTNDISVANLGDVAAVSTIDASASTGTNTIKVGSGLNTTDTVKGGTGADTLVATFGQATLVKPTISGVETLKADFDAAAVVDLSNATGLTTITLDGAAADMTLTKAAASVETLNVTSSAAAQDLSFGYASATPGDLTVNIGTTATTAADIDLAAATFTNTASFVLNTVGTKVYDFDGIDLNGDQSAVSITANADLTTAGIDVTNGDVGSFDVTVGADTSYSGGLYLSKGDLGDVTYTVAAGADGQIYLETDEGSIGNVTITGEGMAAMGIGVSGGGSLGDITIDLTGEGASGSYFGAIVSGGTIGDISISVADYANIDFDISGNAYQFGDTDENGTDGNIGNVMITVGDNSYVSGNINTSGGDIGNVSVTVDGVNASGNLDVHAIFLSGDMDDDTAADDYVRGGNIGDISVSITGENANFTMEAGASGGNVGNVTFEVTGDGASGWLGVQATAYGSGSPGGNIGDVMFTVGNNADAELGLNFDLTIGSIDIAVGDGSYAGLYVSGGSSGDAVLSDVNATLGDDSSSWFQVGGLGGDVGNFTVTAGVDGGVGIGLYSVSGDIGNVSITAGNGASGNVYFSGNAGDVGDVTITLGDNASAGFHSVSSSGGAFGDIMITVGDDSYAQVYFSGASGSVGNTTITAGANSNVDFGFSGAGNGGLGDITIIGGDAASDADVYVSDDYGVAMVGTVDLSDWAGTYTINLDAVVLGTTILVGGAGGTVTGTEGADNIFGGAGDDTFVFDTTPTTVDTVFDFKGGTGNDVLDVAHIGNFTAYTADTADTLANGDILLLTDIAGNEDITTAAGLLAALNAGGEYASVDAAGTGDAQTIITAASAGSTTYYIFEAVDANDANADFDTITLVGVVNASTAFSALVAGNVA